MPTSKRYFATLLVLLIAYQGFSQYQRARTPLPVAVAHGQARVTIRGTGGSSGDTIKVDIAKGPNAGPGPVDVSVPPGTVLTNGNGAGQNMVVAGLAGRATSEHSYTPTSYMVASGSKPVTYVLSAFCMNFDKDNPSPSDEFTVGDPDSVLACILKNSRQLTIPARQAAVWIYTDNVSFNHMNEKFSVSPQEYSQAQELVNRCR